MDEADMTQAREQFVELENRYKSRRLTTTATATGECLFCEAPVDPPRRWCNAQCRDDWQLVNQED